MNSINDITYLDVQNLIKNLVQNQGAKYDTNVIEPVIRMMAVPSIARAKDWSTIFRPYTLTLTTTQDIYGLPYDFEKFSFLKDKNGELHELSNEEFHTKFPDRSQRNSNSIKFYTVEKYQGVHTQPASAETITLTAGSEDGSKVVLVRGNVSDVDDYEEVTLNASGVGTTTKSLSEIMYATKQVAFTNPLTISGTTSGTTFGVIPPEHRTSFYSRMILDSKPTEALQYIGRYLSKAVQPQNDYDVFRFPADLIIYKTLNILFNERREAGMVVTNNKMLEDEIDNAAKRDVKSYTILSAMELTNPHGQSVVPDDHPLID